MAGMELLGRGQNKNEWLHSILNDTSSTTDAASINQSQTPSRQRIQKVPQMLRLKDIQDFDDKYFVPKVVSIGPYHFGNPNLKPMQNRKPKIARMFMLCRPQPVETVVDLYDNLYNKIQELKDCYQDKSPDCFADDELFTRMMLLDGCFILSYIECLWREFRDLGSLFKRHEEALVWEDLFLLENQIPFLVLEELMKPVKDFWMDLINMLLSNKFHLLQPERHWTMRYSISLNVFSNLCDTGSKDDESDVGTEKETHVAHLLDHVRIRLVGRLTDMLPHGWVPPVTLPTVSELLEVGIRFRRSRTSSIKFRSTGFSANLELPVMSVNLLLNLVAYEIISNIAENRTWVTSYMCFLDSLIDHPEDVKELRRVRVLHDNSASDDHEIAKLVSEIGGNLVHSHSAYAKAVYDITMHSENKFSKWLFQLRNEYFKNPWSLVALLGALYALLLSSIQTYFTVWPRK